MKPTIPQGTRDFNAATIRKRNYIFSTIRNVFELYGFQPLETPAMENLETLTGKYGDEGDKLIYRILDSGNPFSKEFLQTLRQNISVENAQIWGSTLEGLQIHNGNKSIVIENLSEEEKFRNGIGVIMWNNIIDSLSELKSGVSSKALRYDLTIPFARYVAMNYTKLNFPFKRYQIQPVWRADRPQKGRYREFYQCDADIVGSNSLLNEIELLNIYSDVFKALNVAVEIKINNRKMLAALAELCGGANNLPAGQAGMMDITIAIDKLDKIGIDKVKEELQQRNLNKDQINIIEKYLLISGTNEEKLIAIKDLFADNTTAKKGIEELEYILNFSPLTSHVSLDFTLARGLNYYTGTIIEVKALNVQMGSIGGGGRYDDLTGLFDVPNLPGVGISFGVDRIYDVMEELKLFPESVQTTTKVLFFNLGEAETKTAYKLLQQLRGNNVQSEIYHEPVKREKQFKFAENNKIPFVVIIGSKELESNTCMVKNIQTGKQETIPQQELISYPFK